MPKENSAVGMLLDKINDLVRRVELLEERVLRSTYTNITQTPTITASRNGYSIGATPTVTRAEMTAYGASIADMYQSRMDELEAQLQEQLNQRAEEANQYRFDIGPDGNIYINNVNRNATDANQ